MPRGTYAFWAFFGLTYMSIGAFTFIALSLLDVGLSPSQVGILLGVLPVVQVIAYPAWGILADVTGRAKLLLTGACLGLAAISLVMWRTSAFVLLFVLTISFAAVRSGILPLATALGLEHLGARDVTFGRIRLWGSLGFAAAVFVVGWKVARPHPSWVLPVHALFIACAGFVAAVLPGGGRVGRPALHSARGLGTQLRPLLWLLAAGALAGIGLGVNNTFLAVFLRDLGGPAWILGLAFAIAALGEVPLMAGMHHLIAWLGLYTVVGMAFIALTIRWMLYAVLHTPWPILPLQLLHSVAIACLEVAGVLLVRQVTAPEWAATGQALYGAAAMGLGPGIGAVMAGAVYQSRTLHAAFAISAVLSAAAWVLFRAGAARPAPAPQR